MTSTANDMPVDVLVCGAGPTGLVLAYKLHQLGVRVRVIDAAPGPGTTSRALVVHARTLELYRQMGLADGLLAEGVQVRGGNLWVRGKRVGHAELGEIGTGMSPFPFLTVVPQDRHERFLVAALERGGLAVERSTRLEGFEQSADGVRATIVRADGSREVIRAAYLAGCDGAHSRVREVLGIGFPGGTYAQYFYVADVEASGALVDGDLHVALDDADFLAVFPLKGGRTARLVGIARAEREGSPENLRWEDVQSRVIGQLGVAVERVNWFSTYKVHHRVANRFSDGRVFLLGDAAHIHSPAGGQGMNTGIGDAVNLGWKLAEVVKDGAAPALLESYAPERRAFAQKLVATTDQVFVAATSPGKLARFVRTRIVPRVVPVALRLEMVKRLAFLTLSQIAIEYRASALSAGELGEVRGGDRLPWTALDGGSRWPDNYAVLDGHSWQVHVYGVADEPLADACERAGLVTCEFPWQTVMADAGLIRDGLYLVRPDGYLAMVARAGEIEKLVHHYGRIRTSGA